MRVKTSNFLSAYHRAIPLPRSKLQQPKKTNENKIRNSDDLSSEVNAISTAGGAKPVAETSGAKPSRGADGLSEPLDIHNPK